MNRTRICVNVVVAVLKLTHRHCQVHGHRAGLEEEYLRKKIKKAEDGRWEGGSGGGRW